MPNFESIESSDIFKENLEAYFLSAEWKQADAPIGARVVLYRAHFRAVNELGSAVAWELIARARQEYSRTRNELEAI